MSIAGGAAGGVIARAIAELQRINWSRHLTKNLKLLQNRPYFKSWN